MKRAEPERTDRELRMERALRLARKVLTTETAMVADALVLIDNVLAEKS